MATLIRGDGRTVTAYQDAVGFDFAFRNLTGIIAGIGQECKISVVGNTATVSSGMAVLQGRQIIFDGTDKIVLPTYQGTNIYSAIYAELDMAGVDDNNKQGIITIKHIDSTTSKFPQIPPSDDLNISPKGKANIFLAYANILSGQILIRSIGDNKIFAGNSFIVKGHEEAKPIQGNKIDFNINKEYQEYAQRIQVNVDLIPRAGGLIMPFVFTATRGVTNSTQFVYGYKNNYSPKIAKIFVGFADKRTGDDCYVTIELSEPDDSVAGASIDYALMF